MKILIKKEGIPFQISALSHLLSISNADKRKIFDVTFGGAQYMCFLFFFNAKEKNWFMWAFFLTLYLAVWMLISHRKTVPRGTWVIRWS